MDGVCARSEVPCKGRKGITECTESRVEKLEAPKDHQTSMVRFTGLVRISPTFVGCAHRSFWSDVERDGRKIKI